MSENNISLDPDQALVTVTKLSDGQDVAATVSNQVESHGAGEWPAANFKTTLNQYVQDIREGMTELNDELDSFQAEIKKRVEEMAALDEELAAKAAQFSVAVTVQTAGNSASDLAAAFTTKQSSAGSGGVTW